MDFIKHYEKGLYFFTFENNEDKAIEEYKKSIFINPSYAQAYYDLGYIYTLKNNLKSAIEYYQLYLSFNPNANDKLEVTNIIDKLKYKSEINIVINNLKNETKENCLFS